MKLIGGNTVQPLLKLGLLQPDPAVPHRLVVSERGHATWTQFISRGGRFREDVTGI